MPKLYKVFVESYIYADNEEEAKDIGYDSLSYKLNCGLSDVEVEEVEEEEEEGIEGYYAETLFLEGDE